jgi:hypothetical protein
MIWITITLISAIFGLLGVWSFYEKRRLRNLLLGDREMLAVDQIFEVFNDSGIYETSWLVEILEELADSTSTKIGLIRPTDKLGKELMPIKGFDEGFDRFDWLPSGVYSCLRDDLTLGALVKLLWIDYQSTC